MIRPKIILLIALLAALGFVAWYRLNPPPTPVAIGPAEIPLGRLTLKDGKLYRPSEKTPFTGFVIEYYPGHVIKSRAQVTDGKLHGLSEGWHTNGLLQVQEHFVQGVSHGERTKWHPNGKKQSTASIIDGKIDGTFRRWNEDGTIAEEIPMKNGQPHGTSQAFYPSGFLKAQAKLDNGAVIEQHTWKDGETKSN
jgi:antitoxin component YwqK of YwqJK toxin-antitoxin module